MSGKEGRARRGRGRYDQKEKVEVNFQQLSNDTSGILIVTACHDQGQGRKA